MARRAVAGKEPFDIDRALELVRLAVKPYARAALFELFDEGHRSVFELLAACILSIRTRDEITLPVARGLFAQVRTPEAVAGLKVKELERLIGSCAFADRKAVQIHAIARRAVAEHGGELPCDREVLLSLGGVGPKCANLALGIACGLPFIGVDVHVHRVTNRWGYVAAEKPEKTMVELERKLPKEYWVAINELLVPFGKHVCTGVSPHCSGCPVRGMCRQVGVTGHR